MANSALDDLFEEKIKPHLFLVKKMVEENRTTREICKMLGIEIGEWKLCKRHCHELHSLVEKIRGRNSEFYTKVLPIFDDIETWLIEGLTLTQVQNKIGLSEGTINIYFKLYPYFKEFWYSCLDKKNDRVVDSVYKRANGYVFEEKKESIEEGEYLYNAANEPIFETYPDGSFKLDSKGKKIHSRKKGKIKLEKTTKEIPADVGAATFWLTNKSDWSRKDQEKEEDPYAIANQIKLTLEEMESKVPEGPQMTTTEKIMDLLSNMNKQELKSLIPVINRVVEDVQ